MLRSSLFLSFFFVSVTILSAQENKLHSYQVGVKGGYGFIIPHSPAMEYITNQHISKFEIYAEKNTFGAKKWHQRYGFPRLGLSFNYFNLNNPQHLGVAFSLAPYLNFNLLGKNRVRLRLRTTIGPGYIEKPFDSDDNFKNSAIGSKVNLFFSILLETEIDLSNRVGFTIGTNFSHFSNTSFQKPNKGLNIPTIEGGMIYKFGPQEIKSRENHIDFQKQKGIWRLSLGVGVNEIYPPGEDKYIATYGSIGYEKRISPNGSVGGNFDVFYNPAQKAALARDSIYIDAGWQNTQLGISADYTLHFGKFETFILVGYYLKKEDDELTDIYTMFGARLHLSNRLNAMIALKTHVASAEYFAVGLGYKFGKK